MEKGIYFTAIYHYLIAMNEPQQDNGKVPKAPADKALAPRLLESALKSLIKLFSATRFYPPGHPSLKETTQEACKGFLHLLQGRDSLTLSVRRDHFVLGEDKVGTDNPLLGKLATQLFMRRIQNLLFLPDLSTRDMWNFVQVLTLDPNEIHKRGGIQKIIEQLRIATIWVNELNLSSVLDQKEKLEAEQPELIDEELMFSADISAVLDDIQKADEGGAEDEEESAKTPELKLETLLRQLRQEGEDAEFLRLALQLPPLIRLCLNEAGRFATLQALTFLGIWSSDKSLSTARAEAAANALSQLTNDEILDFVIGTLCTKGLTEDQREQTLALFPTLGRPLALRLMSRLASESDSWARKILSDGLVRLGQTAIGVVLESLADERWFVVRNCVAILGEIRDPVAVLPMQKLLYHTDIRVRRETVRALTRIGGTEAVNILLRTLEEKDHDLRRQALISLGAMKHPAAVPALLRIVGIRDPRVRELEIKRDAIRALGEIGSPEAVAPLAELVVKRKFWYRSRFDQLRATATSALGDIGDPAAAEILQWATNDRSEIVARAAVQALKQFPKVENK